MPRANNANRPQRVWVEGALHKAAGTASQQRGAPKANVSVLCAPNLGFDELWVLRAKVLQLWQVVEYDIWIVRVQLHEVLVVLLGRVEPF